MSRSNLFDKKTRSCYSLFTHRNFFLEDEQADSLVVQPYGIVRLWISSFG